MERLPARFDEQAGYEIVIEEFQKKFGESKLLLDSNKIVEPLYFLRKRPGLEIRGIHTLALQQNLRRLAHILVTTTAEVGDE